MKRAESIRHGVNPAMVDLFAAALLIFASRAQVHYEQVPVVERTTPGQQISEQLNSVELRLTNTGMNLEGEPTTWVQLTRHLREMSTNDRICVLVEIDADGRGPVQSVMRLSILATETGRQTQVVLLSKEKDSSIQPADGFH